MGEQKRESRSGRFTLPMTAAGGAFLSCVGIGLIGFAFAPADMRAAIAIGTVVTAIIALIGVAILSAKRGVARPTSWQIILLYSTIGVEFIVLWLLSPHLNGERMLWIAVLAVVGLHFLPMYWTHGLRIVLLGFACAAMAMASFLVAALPLSALIATDGALKVLFGLWMLSALPGRRASTAGVAK